MTTQKIHSIFLVNQKDGRKNNFNEWDVDNKV